MPHEGYNPSLSGGGIPVTPTAGMSPPLFSYPASRCSIPPHHFCQASPTLLWQSSASHPSTRKNCPQDRSAVKSLSGKTQTSPRPLPSHPCKITDNGHSLMVVFQELYSKMFLPFYSVHGSATQEHKVLRLFDKLCFLRLGQFSYVRIRCKSFVSSLSSPSFQLGGGQSIPIKVSKSSLMSLGRVSVGSVTPSSYNGFQPLSQIAPQSSSRSSPCKG